MHRGVQLVQNCPTLCELYIHEPIYLNNIINPVSVPLHEQHMLNFIFMDNNALFIEVIIRERLLETGAPQMEPALSPDLNPIENL